tara:strand:+ start:394 stop:534 length:141 start_codon:yes stop_codon:yes gene_type:complete
MESVFGMEVCGLEIDLDGIETGASDILDVFGKFPLPFISQYNSTSG